MKYAALVTGSSRGIGKSIALALASEGFAIGVNARTENDQVAATLAELRETGVTAVPVIGDVGESDRHESLLDTAESALGPLTTLVNNAGVSVMKRGDLLEVTPESYDRCQRINCRGAFFLTQAWARRAVARERPAGIHHCVITVSSANARAASIGRGEYCISKAGESMMGKLFAVRLGSEGIGSYEIQPGLIETDMSAPAHDHYRRRIEEGLTIVPRMGKPDDLGSIAVAMATGRLSFCTGQAVQADGGLLIQRF